MKHFAICIFFLGLLQANEAFSQTKPTPSFLQWVGFWQVSSNSSGNYEQWELTLRNLLNGKGIEVRNGDTIILEQLRLLKKGKSYFYEAKVLNQNQGKPILFKMTECDNRVYRFENPQHDFPQMIQYTFESPNSVEVLLSTNPALSHRKEIKLHLTKP